MSVSVLLGPLQKLLDSFIAERHYKDEKKDLVLAAINKALLETKKYQEQTGGGKNTDREREFELAGLWADAATKARYANNEIAMRLQDKSLFWSEDLKWSRDEVLARKIDLDSMQSIVAELLEAH